MALYYRKPKWFLNSVDHCVLQSQDAGDITTLRELCATENQVHQRNHVVERLPVLPES
jgi:hypothetical protein